MTTTEEFSFPTSTDLYPSGIDSPPLWRLSPTASPDVLLHSKGKQQQDDDDDEDHKGLTLKQSNKADDEDEDKEEKMDMLWEDFNEELPESTRSSSKSSIESGSGQAMKLSKNKVVLFSPSPRRAAGVLVFMRVLRKLFLLHHNSHHRSVK